MASSFPARLGTAEQFQTLVRYFEEARYTEKALLAAFRVEELNDLLMADGEERARLKVQIEQPGLQMLLARLLLGGYAVPWREASRLIPGNVFDILQALGLYDVSGRCPVLLYPALGFYVASDRPESSDGQGYAGPDFVMSALEHLSRTYVNAIGRTRCRRFLEVGSGAGLGALCATRFADEVWATDITERSIACMEFNRRLNGVDEAKMHVVCGDMYQPVEGMRFDRIACNPPFEPPLRHGMIYALGGADGEQLMERVVRGAVERLEPRGRLYCQVLGTDRKGDSLFARMGRWVEGAGIAYFVRSRMSTDSYTAGHLMKTGSGPGTVAECDRFYGGLLATHVSTGHLIVEKDAAFAFMEQLGRDASVEEMERRIEWDEAYRKTGWRERILDGQWATSGHCMVDVLSTVRNGEFVEVDCVLRSMKPIVKSQPVHAVMRNVLSAAACGGSGREIVDKVGAVCEPEVLASMAVCVGVGALQERSEAAERKAERLEHSQRNRHPELESLEDEPLSRWIPDKEHERILVMKAGVDDTVFAASKRAKTVVAVETSPRLRQALEAQLRQRGITNVQVKAGLEDGARFELVLVPNMQREMLEATLKPAGGEKRLARTLNRAVGYLAPKGKLVTGGTICWHAGEKIEAQVRDLIPAGRSCGIHLYQLRERSTVEFAVEMSRGPNPMAATLEECIRMLAKADSRSVDDVVIMISPVEVPLVVRAMAPPLDTEASHRSFDWECARQAEGFDAGFAKVRPRLGEKWRIRETHEMWNGEFTGGTKALVIEHPFAVEFPFPAWLEVMLPLADGQRTVTEIVSTMGEHGVSAANTLFGLQLLWGYEVIHGA
ncbi:MAG: methyltransferase [Acidobacteria bacterium]|nr:methyltransferase [Acidobacteriota bacterium]